ncbi:hypothetical protein ACFDTO_33065 [Microbacteriaceae bacterium 4G12]
MKRYVLLFIGYFIAQVLVHIVLQTDKTVLEMVGMSVLFVAFWWLFDYIFSGTKKKDV